MKLSPFSGEQIVQVTNPDPFAKPVLRSPVLHTPVWIIACAQLVRLTWRLLRFAARHPVVDLIIAALALTWRYLGWPGPVTITGSVIGVGLTWRLAWPGSWIRHVAIPARTRWRRWHYKRCWTAVMTISRLAVYYRGRLLLPLLGPVTTTSYLDRLHVRLVSGQSPDDFADRADNLAHGFGAIGCRIRTAGPGAVVVELVRRDALAAIIPALPVPDRTDLRALAIGRGEDGTPWQVRLHGSHVLLAGSTGAGKASILWAIIRALLPALHDGTARVLAADPKLMELAYGRAIFDRYGRYESDPEEIIAMLEDAVAGMQARASKLAGRQRDHTPTAEHPFTVVLIDEVAFLTAYQPDRKLRERALAAIATLTTQGRAVGYSVVAAVQDPRKDVLTIRNLFPDRIAMRLDEPEQVDMVLGDGSRDRGATADLISTDPATGAGIAYVRVDPDPDPVRVRAAWVTDDDITAMCRQYAPPRGTTPDLAINCDGVLA
jgi:DNA segregation ATPase FtsK/SpoIIIE, S-DNA-T family